MGRQRCVQVLLHEAVDARGLCKEDGGGYAGFGRRELVHGVVKSPLETAALAASSEELKNVMASPVFLMLMVVKGIGAVVPMALTGLRPDATICSRNSECAGMAQRQRVVSGRWVLYSQPNVIYTATLKLVRRNYYIVASACSGSCIHMLMERIIWPWRRNAITAGGNIARLYFRVPE